MIGVENLAELFEDFVVGNSISFGVLTTGLASLTLGSNLFSRIPL